MGNEFKESIHKAVNNANLTGATISNGLLLVGIDNFWITVFLGVVLLLAVVLDRVTRAVGGAGP